VFSLIVAGFKQIQIKNFAKPNDRTNFYIRQFYKNARFVLLSVIVGVWKPSETSIKVNI
jgi:hypothetical protein